MLLTMNVSGFLNKQALILQNGVPRAKRPTRSSDLGSHRPYFLRATDALQPDCFGRRFSLPRVAMRESGRFAELARAEARVRAKLDDII